MNIFGSKITKEQLIREAWIKKNITETFQTNLKILQREFISTNKPITSNDVANSICNSLAAVFIHGVKSSIFSQFFNRDLISDLETYDKSNLSFWQFLTHFTHKNEIYKINRLGQITTETGMCQAWIRLALNDGLFASYLDSIINEVEIRRKYYRREAYLRDNEQPEILRSYMNGLSELVFQLPYNSSVLNVWTIAPLVLAGLVESSVNETVSPITVNESSQPSYQPPVNAEPVNVISTKKIKKSKSSKKNNANSKKLGSTEREINSVEETSVSSMDGVASTPTSTVCILPDHLVEENRSQNSSSLKSLSYQTATTIENIQSSSLTQGTAVSSSVTSSFCDIDVDDVNVKNMLATNNTCSNVNNSPKSTSILDCGNHVDSDGIPVLHNQDFVTSKLSSSFDQTETSSYEEMFLSSCTRRCSLPPHLGVTVPNKVLHPKLSTVVAVADHTGETEQLSENAITSLSNLSATGEVEIENSGNRLDMLIGWSSATGNSTDYLISGSDDLIEHSNKVEIDTSGLSTKEMGLLPESQLNGSTEIPSPKHQFDFHSLLSNHDDLVVPYSTSPVEAESANSSPQQNLSSMTTNRTDIAEGFSPANSSEEETQVDFDEEQIMKKEYEVLSLSPSTDEHSYNEANYISMIGQISQENGLDHQNYQCFACSRPIGIIYGRPRVCSFDSRYYCQECHVNDEYFIPARIIHNWQLNKFKISRNSLCFLRHTEEMPLLNIRLLNESIYDHVTLMAQAQRLRLQLKYLRAYLFTCKQSVAESLRKRVWPREYYYDDIDLYSLKDLLRVSTGEFSIFLQRVIRFARNHVQDCSLCQQKGFFCEICNDPKIIFPFDLDQIYSCSACQAVYHRSCMRDHGTCPRCRRRRVRYLHITTDVEDEDPELFQD